MASYSFAPQPSAYFGGGGSALGGGTIQPVLSNTYKLFGQLYDLQNRVALDPFSVPATAAALETSRIGAVNQGQLGSLQAKLLMKLLSNGGGGGVETLTPQGGDTAPAESAVNSALATAAQQAAGADKARQLSMQVANNALNSLPGFNSQAMTDPLLRYLLGSGAFGIGQGGY